MRYESMEAFCSTLMPKLLGSYEHELHDVIERIARTSYSSIVDIGCAEGYYAVGLARRINNARIFAFDTDCKALQNCMAMARLNNNVHITLGALCDEKLLLELELGEKSLLILDCEGYETRLITKNLICRLIGHDFVDIYSTQKILEAFSGTHSCEIIRSIDDIEKAYSYDFPEIRHLSLEDRYHVLAEMRPSIMRWIFAVSSTGSD